MYRKKVSFLCTSYIHQSLSFVYLHPYIARKNFIIDLLIFCLAGSYAQLTLLGQPKANNNLTSQTQKSIPVDIQNGRTQYRTQSSNNEKSNNSVNSNSNQPVFDTKKARDSYEKILKQFEVIINLLNFHNKVFFSRFRKKNLNDNEQKVLLIIHQEFLNLKIKYVNMNNN